MKTMFKTIALAAIASLALTGCIKHEPYGHHTNPGPDNGGHGGNKTEEKLVLNERSDWSIRYIDREDWVDEETGAVDRVEHFKLAYKGNGFYIVRMITKENYENPEVYNKDAAAFFKYEAESLVADAKKDGVNFWQYTDEVFDAKITDIYFNRLRSGTWIAFLIELDTNGKATGNYAETSFTLKQETATESFNKWLGTWRASNGLMGYDLTISSIENNFIYRIDGWECGQAASCRMDQEYLEGEFWADNGYLYIRSQFLGSYEDENLGSVDELFMGNIFDSNGLKIITDEGIDIAVMVWQGEGKAEMKGENVTIKTNNGDYDTQFHSVQYYMWAQKDSNWYPYNESVAELPLTMTKLRETRAAEQTLAPERKATKASVHHSQPKAGRGSRNNVAKKAVRLK